MNSVEVISWFAIWAVELSRLLAEMTTTMAAGQVDSLAINAAFLTAYILLVASRYTASRAHAFLAVLICILIGYSPLYHLAATQGVEYNVAYYSSFAFVYGFASCAIFKISRKSKIALGCCIMALFQMIMAWDRYDNAGVATWTYSNYENIVSVIHGIIIGSVVKWRHAWTRLGMDRAVDFVRGLIYRAGSAACL